MPVEVEELKKEGKEKGREENREREEQDLFGRIPLNESDAFFVHSERSRERQRCAIYSAA